MSAAQLGAGVALAWLGLPLLWRAARAPEGEPASRHRALVLALAAANLLVAAPGLWAARPPSLTPTPGGLPSAVVAGAGRLAAALSPERGPHLLALLGEAWLVVTLLGLARTVAQAARLRAVLARATPAPEADSVTAWTLAREAGVPPPRLLVSAEVGVPCAASLWRPAIVLPVGLRAALDAPAFACVLRHELAHLARADQGWLLLTTLLQLPFTLHPLLPRLRAELSLAREEAVDAVVARADAHTYARSLLAVASQGRLGPRFPEAVSMGASALARRVDMLTNPKPMRRASLLPVFVVTLGLASLALAGPAADPPPAAEAKEVVLKLTVGTRKVLAVKQLTRAAVGDPAIADVTLIGPEQLLVTAKSSGKTTLLVWVGEDRHLSYLIDVP